MNSDSTPRTELTAAEREAFWPALPFAEWQQTAETLRLWTQIVGKVRLKLTPWITFEIRFDFTAHELRVLKSDGAVRVLKLRAQSVAEFYRAIMHALGELELSVKIDRVPNEIVDVIPFDRDETHRSYDEEYANRFWRVLVQAERVLTKFRSRFCGKCSPVHFFWGSFDLAVTRFSGRSAPPHPGGVPHLSDAVAREAYAHEVSSIGFWPGDSATPAAFYSYAYPEPDGFAGAKVRPPQAYYSAQLHEFLLPYEAARNSPSPDDSILDFAQSVYEAASTLGRWDREVLEEARLHPPSRNE